jgi:signal peptidase I
MNAGKRLYYRGRSMQGTFNPGDLLTIEEIPFGELKPGDVIVFRQDDPFAKKDLVHRFVSRSRAGAITRGDNNPKTDEVPVREENFVGKVAWCDRAGKTMRVCNGRAGLLRAWALHGRVNVWRAARFFLRRPYRWGKKTGIAPWIWRPQIEAIRFETVDGPMIKHVHRGKTVAVFWIGRNHRWFRRPYDLIIDQNKVRPRLQSHGQIAERSSSGPGPHRAD